MARRSRRELFKVGGAAALTVGLAACSAPAPTPATSAAPPAPKPAAKPKPPEKPAVIAPAPPTTVPVQAAAPTPTQPSLAPRPLPLTPPAQRTLVMIQLGGGDDGLNFLVPHGNGVYYDLRPKVAIPQAD